MMLRPYLYSFEHTHAVVKWPKVRWNVQSDSADSHDKLQGDGHHLSATQVTNRFITFQSY